MQKLFLQG